MLINNIDNMVNITNINIKTTRGKYDKQRQTSNKTSEKFS